jgi:hypothetical protein
MRTQQPPRDETHNAILAIGLVLARILARQQHEADLARRGTAKPSDKE